MTTFYEACENGDINEIKKYLSDKNFTSLNEKHYFGTTPFYMACFNGHKEVCELLIKTNGFTSLNEKNINGITPFNMVCCNGRKEICELLIKTDGFNSLNETDNDGDTPFHWACFNGHREICELLIKTDGFNSLNKRDNDRNTPFYLACYNDHKEVCELLFKCHNIIVPHNIETNNAQIKELIERYKKDPEAVRLNLILKGNIDLYRHIIFLCDGYFKLKENIENQQGLRFMKIASKLPIELQMTLIHRLSGSVKAIITAKQFDENIIEYIKFFY
jgi:hypothetical protein